MLKFLNLSYSHSLVKTPDFSKISNLERLNLEGCKSLVEVDESIGDLKRLALLNLKDCKNLRGLPKSMGKLEGLEILSISGCSNLKGVPMELRSMESLRVFEADGTDVGGLFKGLIEEVRPPWHALMWWSYESKPRRSISSEISWPSLESLSIEGCNLFNEDFPRELSNLRKLRHLNLSGNPIVYLPHCFRGLSSLRHLSVRSCTELRSLVGPLQLDSLETYGCISLDQLISIGTCEYSYSALSEMFEFVNRYKLQPISKMDAEMVKYLGLDLLHLKSMQNVAVYTEDWTTFHGGSGKRLIKVL